MYTSRGKLAKIHFERRIPPTTFGNARIILTDPCSPSRYPEKSVRRVRNIRGRAALRNWKTRYRPRSAKKLLPCFSTTSFPPLSRSEGEGEASGKRRRVKRFAVIYGTRARFLAIKGSFLIVIFLIDRSEPLERIETKRRRSSRFRHYLSHWLFPFFHLRVYIYIYDTSRGAIIYFTILSSTWRVP